MRVHVIGISGYTEAINALRISKGKFYSYEKMRDIQQLVGLLTDERGFLVEPDVYYARLSGMTESESKRVNANDKIFCSYEADVAEFYRLLGLTKDNAMGKQKHQTLMEYLDISFITEDMHRGAQDDLDSHARSFNNRITRFSTRLAEIEDVKLSDWYRGKVMTFSQVNEIVKDMQGGYLSNFSPMPETVVHDSGTYRLTPFGYVLEKHATVPAKNGYDKDVQRGLMPIGIASTAQWKIGASSLRYVYKMRSKFTKTNPELKEAMEMLADELERVFPVFGQHFRYELTDTGEWEHLSKVKTVTFEDFQLLKKIKAEMRASE